MNITSGGSLAKDCSFFVWLELLELLCRLLVLGP
jgi:hypothetical protein